MTEPHDTEHYKKDDLLNKITSTLDSAVDELEGGTKSRLRSIRHEALTSTETSYRTTWWVPAGSLAALAAIAVMTVSLWTIMPEEDEFKIPFEDFALLSDKEELEFYEELDFYLWLDSEQLKNENKSNEQNMG